MGNEQRILILEQEIQNFDGRMAFSYRYSISTDAFLEPK